MQFDWENSFSHTVIMPVHARLAWDESLALRLDWRGIPLALPYAFYSFRPNTRMRIAKCWLERSNYYLKLVHPSRGVTVDYALRGLISPVREDGLVRRFVLLEMAPLYLGDDASRIVTESEYEASYLRYQQDFNYYAEAMAAEAVAKWVLVEYIDATTIATLPIEVIDEQRSVIETLVRQKLALDATVVQVLFEEMLPWENPAWGDVGNLHLVCPRCLKPMRKEASSCTACSTTPHPLDVVLTMFDAMPTRRNRYDVWIFVVGTLHSGVSSFICTLTENEIYHDTTQSGGDTPLLAFGRLTLAENLVLYFCSTTGQQRADEQVTLMREINSAAAGIVLLVDSFRPETFYEAQVMLRKQREYWGIRTAPTIIALDKQDVTGAFSVEDRHDLFSEDAQTHIMPCVATNHDSAEKIVVELLQMIADSIRKG